MERKNIAAAPRMCNNSSEIFEGGMEHAVFSNRIVLSAVSAAGQMCGEGQRAELPVFYPKEYIAEAQRRGIADRDEVIHLE